MRLWSIHPKYLDTKGLAALWRESLLAKKVLQGKTKGYKRHPQLERFRGQKNPVASINSLSSRSKSFALNPGIWYMADDHTGRIDCRFGRLSLSALAAVEIFAWPSFVDPRPPLHRSVDPGLHRRSDCQGLPT